MSHVVEPLFVEWQRFTQCHRSRLMLAHLRNNRVAWQRKKASSMTPSSAPSNRGPSSSAGCRRHSVPSSHDTDARSRGRRHSAPHAGLRLSVGILGDLVELSECSPSSAQSDGRFQFTGEPQPVSAPPVQPPISAPSACLDYNHDRRLSLNTACSPHAQRTVTPSRMRSRSLVTPSCYPGNGVAFGHLAVTSSSSRDLLPTIRTTGWWLRTVQS